MIELPEFKDEKWYLNEVKRLFVHGNTLNKNFEEKYNNNVKVINESLNKIISIDDFSQYRGRIILEELILAPFSDLKRIYEKIQGKEDNLFFEIISDKNEKKMKPEWEHLNKIYDKFSKRGINAGLVEKYGIKSCPYCNENYIFNREKTVMAQLDHFYPRKKYPIFSICLYNLVPACSACNHIKGEKMIGVSPHDHSYDYKTLKISYIPKSSNWINDDKEIQMNFKIEQDKTDFNEKIQLNLNMMKIQRSYDMHTDYVQEILKKAQIYNQETRRTLLNDFPQLFSSDEEILRVIFSNYIENRDMLKRPLSKLTTDILIELGIV